MVGDELSHADSNSASKARWSLRALAKASFLVALEEDALAAWVFLGPRAQSFGALGILIAPYARPSTGVKPVHGYG